MSGWFKAGTRWHIVDADGARSLCARYEAPSDVASSADGRPCARCSLIEVEDARDQERAAHLAAHPPRPASDWHRELTPEEASMTQRLIEASRDRKRYERAAGR